MALRFQHRTTDDDSVGWDAAAVDGFPWLFVGSLSAAENHAALTTHNVARLFTVASKLDVANPPLCVQDHVTIEIDDHPLANLMQVAQQCVDVLDMAAKDAESFEERKVPPAILVHCASGLSRSVSSVMAWLMIRKRYCLDEALGAIRVHRPLANPNIGFMQQLEMLQKHTGNLEAACKEWSQHAQKDLWELTSARRRTANELHAQVDDLEVHIQQFVSASRNHQDDSIEIPETTQSTLMREVDAISDELDQAKGDSQGLPMDRVTGFIIKSARNKLEKVIKLLSSVDNSTQ